MSNNIDLPSVVYEPRPSSTAAVESEYFQGPSCIDLTPRANPAKSYSCMINLTPIPHPTIVRSCPIIPVSRGGMRQNPHPLALLSYSLLVPTQRALVSAHSCIHNWEGGPKEGTEFLGEWGGGRRRHRGPRDTPWRYYYCRRDRLDL